MENAEQEQVPQEQGPEGVEGSGFEYVVPGSDDAWRMDLAREVVERHPELLDEGIGQAAEQTLHRIAAELSHGDAALAEDFARDPRLFELAHRANLIEQQQIASQPQPVDPVDVILSGGKNGLGGKVLG